MATDPLHYQTLSATAKRIESGELSPVSLTAHMLERIEAIDGQLKSYATLTAELALQAATQAEAEIAAGNYRGALHGIPLAVKDLCFTKGVRTMGGLAVLQDFIPDYDATVIQRMHDAGAILLGKLNLTEGAMAGYHRDFDIPINPWREDLWPGASSSGSGVATAAGLCFAALGTDTGGSIRFPALANSVVGFKPTYGRVSRHGVLDLGETLDHVGPLARSVEDAARVLQAISGLDPADASSLNVPAPDFTDLDSGIAGTRIGWDPGYAAQGSDPALISSIEAALAVLEDLGAHIVEVAVPATVMSLGDSWFSICTYEACKAHAATYPARRADYGDYFGDFLDMGAQVSDEDYGQAMSSRASFNNDYNAVLGEVDALLCPAGGVAFPLTADQYGGADVLAGIFESVQMHFSIPANFAGTPTLTMPCGFSEADVPHALQLVGSRLSEAALARIGHTYEQATAWHQRHPPI
jgi:amidase